MAAQHTARFLIIATILASLPFAAAAAEPRGRVDNPGSANAEESAHADLWISARIPPPVRARIESSFELAKQRLTEVAECGDLFADLGGNGIEALRSTLYYPASAAQEKKLCRGAWGYTTVGSAPTFLCRKFSRISEKKGAMILIHEALHHAGMGEFPQHGDGLTSAAINTLVEDRCGL